LRAPAGSDVGSWQAVWDLTDKDAAGNAGLVGGRVGALRVDEHRRMPSWSPADAEVEQNDLEVWAIGSLAL
jgi:hypothetical protein